MAAKSGNTPVSVNGARYRWTWRQGISGNFYRMLKSHQVFDYALNGTLQ